MRSFLLACTLTILTLQPGTLQAHCQVPCGIFDDHARVAAMHEDAVTAAKAISELSKLAGKTDPQSLNQMVR